MIQLHNVSKVFKSGSSGTRYAVRDISLGVLEHRITVLKGPSGSGKTTLLSLIGCMARPTTGRIFFSGKEITSLPERFLAELRRQQVGFIFQNYNLIKGISVLENVMLPALPLGHPFPHLRTSAKALLTELKIDHLASMPVQQLSGGEQQRVAIARAMINQPQLLIADEPTAHLDTTLSHQFMDIVSGLQGEDRTVLIASHDPLVCRHAGVNQVVSLRDGKIDMEPGAS